MPLIWCRGMGQRENVGSALEKDKEGSRHGKCKDKKRRGSRKEERRNVKKIGW